SSAALMPPPAAIDPLTELPETTHADIVRAAPETPPPESTLLLSRTRQATSVAFPTLTPPPPPADQPVAVLPEIVQPVSVVTPPPVAYTPAPPAPAELPEIMQLVSVSGSPPLTSAIPPPLALAPLPAIVQPRSSREDVMAPIPPPPLEV